MTRSHKTTTTTAHNRPGARFIPARGGRQARYGPNHRPRDAQPRRRPLPWPRSGDRNLHSWPPGLELPAWGCGSSGPAVPRGKVALQNTRICIHSRGTFITQSTAQIGGSRATAAASDHHVARPTVQSASEPNAESARVPIALDALCAARRTSGSGRPGLVGTQGAGASRAGATATAGVMV